MKNTVYRFYVFDGGCEKFIKEYTFTPTETEPTVPCKGDRWMVEQTVYIVQAVCNSFDVDENGDYLIEVLLMEAPDYKEWWMD